MLLTQQRLELGAGRVNNHFLLTYQLVIGLRPVLCLKLREVHVRSPLLLTQRRVPSRAVSNALGLRLIVGLCSSLSLQLGELYVGKQLLVLSKATVNTSGVHPGVSLL